LERGEFSMIMRWGWTLPVLSSLALTLAASSLLAQYAARLSDRLPDGLAIQAGMPGSRLMGGPAMMGGPGGRMYGQPGMMPGGAMQPPGLAPAGFVPTPNAFGAYGNMSPSHMEGMMPVDGGMGGGMGGGCPQCGGMGCDMCGAGGGHGLCNGL
jgi:hypothetical protein